MNNKQKMVRLIGGSMVVGLSQNQSKNSKLLGCIGLAIMATAIAEYCPLTKLIMAKKS